MTTYVLALDQGTTSSRAILFDHTGIPVQMAQQTFAQIYPAPGLVEHDPEEIWSSQLAVAQEVLRKANVSAAQVAAIGITNQRETTLLWEKATGKPLYNAVVWQSRLSAGICDELKSLGFDRAIQARTGLVTDAYFSGTKLKWLLDNLPQARARAERGELLFGTVDTFLLWRLTGGRVHATDYSNAARTLLFNIHTGTWDDVILHELGIPSSLLPVVLPSSHIYGETLPAFFGAPIRIAGVAGDQQAATFGQACYEPGQAKNTYGTGSFMLMNTGTRAICSQHNLLTTIGWGLASQLTYALEGSIFVTGAAVQWLRDGLHAIENSNEVEALALSVPDNDGVYLVPAFVGLGAPYWDARARGTLLGLTRGTSMGHIARATLESMCYQTRDVLEAMVADSQIELKNVRVDGGAVGNDLLMQFQADILGVTVQRPRVAETTALGAAYLAGLATGFWQDQQELAALWAVERMFEPRMSADQRASLYANWRRAVQRSLNWDVSRDIEQF
jgi:glycerol kinase